MTTHSISDQRERAVKTLAIAIVWPASLVLILMLWLSAGPVIEHRLAPVLDDVSVTDVRLEDSQLCWTLRYTKMRHATPVSMAWAFKVDGNSALIPTVVIRSRDGKPTSTAHVAPVGPAHSNLCTQVPSDLLIVTGMTLEGAIEYRTSHEFWTVWHELPPVKVPRGVITIPQINP